MSHVVFMQVCCMPLGKQIAKCMRALCFAAVRPQQQNSNLTQELPQLLGDVEAQLGFGAAAFGAAPDAVNLWIGDERAATTYHKDHVSWGVAAGLGEPWGCFS